MTLGLLVFVQLVIAAMSTLPWPIVVSNFGNADEGKSSALSGVGWESRISDSLAET